MQIIHKEIGAWRKLSKTQRKQHPWYVKGAGDDPIAPVAKGIATDSHLICFDEFQVSDITDAMLLGRLFEKIFEHGTVMVATSNRAPNELYKDGLNRQLFLPFIDLLTQKLDVLDLQAARDYRRDRFSSQPLYFTPLNANADQSLNKLWSQLTMGADDYPRALQVQGRTLQITKSFGGAAKLEFAELCDQPLGAADYLELAAQFHTVFLEHVPKMGPEQRNQAKRFVLLIDALYEARVKLIISAAADPEALYDMGDGSFEFARCASRLLEMRSDAWAELIQGGKGLAM